MTYSLSFKRRRKGDDWMEIRADGVVRTIVDVGALRLCA
jgi:hypothetical protein